MTEIQRLIRECEKGLKEPEWSGSMSNAKAQARRRYRRLRQMGDLLHIIRIARAFDARKAEDLFRKDCHVAGALLGARRDA